MRHHSLILFLYHTLWVLLLNTYLTGWGFFFFLPFLIQKIYFSSPETCIRAAFFCGLLLDISSGLNYLGLSAISYALLVVLLLRIQPYLIEEKIYSLCILSGISAIFLLCIFPFLSHVIGNPIIGGSFLSLSWLHVIWMNILYTLASLVPFWWWRNRIRSIS